MTQTTILNTLLDGNRLNAEQTKHLFTGIMNGDYDDIALSAILTAMKIRGETAVEIVGASQGILSHVKPFKRPDFYFGDIVGTGGDSYNTINISTTSAIIGASCGAKICKHGNRKVSSNSGAADMLSAIGVDLNASPELSYDLLENAGVCFLMAPNYHPSIKQAMPVRMALGVRTIFNILGPLMNPARPDYIVNGVYNTDIMDMVAQAHALSDIKRATVVHGTGVDEVCLHGTTEIIDVVGDTIADRITLSPSDFGLPEQGIETIAGGTAQYNANATRAILDGTAPQPHKNIVAANVAVLLRTAGIQDNLKQGTQMALNIMEQGTALPILQKIQTLPV